MPNTFWSLMNEHFNENINQYKLVVEFSIFTNDIYGNYTKLSFYCLEHCASKVSTYEAHDFNRCGLLVRN